MLVESIRFGLGDAMHSRTLMEISLLPVGGNAACRSCCKVSVRLLSLLSGRQADIPAVRHLVFYGSL